VEDAEDPNTMMMGVCESESESESECVCVCVCVRGCVFVGVLVECLHSGHII